MTTNLRKIWLFRWTATVLAALWCLPLAMSAAVFAAAPAPEIVLAEALRQAADRHSAVCRCITCDGAAGDPKSCCCTGGGSQKGAESVVWKAACDRGAPLAGLAAAVKVVLSTGGIELSLPVASRYPVSFRQGADVRAASLAPSPHDLPPRLS